MRKTKQCSSCREEIDAKATRCPHCQAKQGSGCLKIFILIILIFIFLSFVSVCISKNIPDTPTVSSSSGSTNKPAPNPYRWSFSEKIDDFDGTETKYCSIEANETIKAGFGTSRPMIQIRLKNNKDLDIIIKAEHVVFGHPEANTKVRLKFDEEEPFKVGFDGAADSSADIIFLRNTKKIIEKLKSSQKLVIEMPVFMESGVRASFDIAGYSEVCKF